MEKLVDGDIITLVIFKCTTKGIASHPLVREGWAISSMSLQPLSSNHFRIAPAVQQGEMPIASQTFGHVLGGVRAPSGLRSPNVLWIPRSKSRLTKAVGAEPFAGMRDQNCMRLWRETPFKAKMPKAPSFVWPSYSESLPATHSRALSDIQSGTHSKQDEAHEPECSHAC